MDEPRPDGPMEEPTDGHGSFDDVPDLPMRTTGFLLTVGGALLAGVAAMLRWVVVRSPGIEQVYLGIDLVEGMIALGVAVVALIAVLASRIGSTAAGRKGAATAVLVAGLVIVAIAVVELLTAESRFVDDVVTEIVDALGDASVDVAAIERTIEVQVQIGVWLTFVGGLAIAAGGIVTRRWTSRRG